MDYQAYLQSDHWRGIRELAMARAISRCQICYSRDKLNVHHRTYERLGNERIEDVTVLCERCHKLYHRSQKRPEEVPPETSPTGEAFVLSLTHYASKKSNKKTAKLASKLTAHPDWPEWKASLLLSTHPLSLARRILKGQGLLNSSNSGCLNAINSRAVHPPKKRGK